MDTRKPIATDAERRKAANRRTAFALLAIAATFFVGIIASRFIGEPTTGISIMGGAVLVFLVVAIGRNLLQR